MKSRRRFVLIRRRTEELVVRHQRFTMSATRRTTYKVTTIYGSSGVSRRVERAKDVVVDLRDGKLRRSRLHTAAVDSEERREPSDPRALARARAELLVALRAPLSNLVTLLDGRRVYLEAVETEASRAVEAWWKAFQAESMKPLN